MKRSHYRWDRELTLLDIPFERQIPLPMVCKSQMLTYLRLSGLESGLLLNFNSVPLKAGVRRLNKSKFSPVSRVSPVSPISPFPSKSRISKADQTSRARTGPELPRRGANARRTEFILKPLAINLASTTIT